MGLQVPPPPTPWKELSGGRATVPCPGLPLVQDLDDIWDGRIDRRVKGLGDHPLALPARLGITALMNIEFLDEAGTGLPPWVRRGSHWQEGVTVTLQNRTTAISLQGSLPSLLTGTSGPPLSSKRASHVQILSLQISHLLSLDCTWTPRLVVSFGSGAKGSQGTWCGCSHG